MGRFDPQRVLGVSESVSSFEMAERPLWLAVEQAASGRWISVWVDDRGELVGLIMGERE